MALHSRPLWQTEIMPEWTELQVVDGLRLRVVASKSGILAIDLRPSGPVSGAPRNDENALLQEAIRQLQSYFVGDLRKFNLPLDMQGTPFQKRVWNQLLKIPYGETRSYTQIAIAAGAPNAVRAVGAANGANPIPIIVPCHRVIGADGRLTGYGGGLPMKKRLLELEGAIPMSL